MRVNDKSTAGRPRKIWAIDCEFRITNKETKPEDILTIQLSDGTLQGTFIFFNVKDFKQFLKNHNSIKIIYGFNVLCDLGAVEEFDKKLVGYRNHEYYMRIKYRKMGAQYQGTIKYGDFEANVYDARPMLHSLGMSKLEDCGALVGIPKMQKPDWFDTGGKWQNQQELEYFIEYAKRDAIITSKIVQWLLSLGIDPARIATAATLSAKTFMLPKRLPIVNGKVELSPIEQKIKDSRFAGRNEVFVSGYTKNAYYNDVSSEYPCAVFATNALRITGVKECKPDEVFIGDTPNNYGWLEGTFETQNDIWGLPYRKEYYNKYKLNHYVTGIQTGLFHTFDLAASKVKVHKITKAYKPIFSEDKSIHYKYAKRLSDKLNDKLTGNEKYRAKGELNGLTGKLGQQKPEIKQTSNFYALTTIYAYSHYILSRLFDMCQSPILGCDTDSIFSQTNMRGKKFDVTDGETTLPILLDRKGYGDLAYFRSKLYMIFDEDQQQILRQNPVDIFKTNPVFARHAWVYDVKDFFKLFDGNVTTADVRREIKHTLFTRNRDAQRLAMGFWRTKTETVDMTKLHTLNADMKRVRDNYDSYALIQASRSTTSRAWSIGELLASKQRVAEDDIISEEDEYSMS